MACHAQAMIAFASSGFCLPRAASNSLTSFSVGRMRIRNGWLITNAALFTYVIPASFLAIPFYLIMQHYGLNNNLWSVIAALVTFATPYAIFIFLEYGRSIPLELDESARMSRRARPRAAHRGESGTAPDRHRRSGQGRATDREGSGDA